MIKLNRRLILILIGAIVAAYSIWNIDVENNENSSIESMLNPWNKSIKAN